VGTCAHSWLFLAFDFSATFYATVLLPGASVADFPRVIFIVTIVVAALAVPNFVAFRACAK
jgi:hypothetical protein